MADSGKSRPTGPTLEEAEKIHAYRIDRKSFFARPRCWPILCLQSPALARAGRARHEQCKNAACRFTDHWNSALSRSGGRWIVLGQYASGQEFPTGEGRLTGRFHRHRRSNGFRSNAGQVRLRRRKGCSCFAYGWRKRSVHPHAASIFRLATFAIPPWSDPRWAVSQPSLWRKSPSSAGSIFRICSSAGNLPVSTS